MRNVRLTRSKLVTTSRRVVMTVLLTALGFTIGIPSAADAASSSLRKYYLTQDRFDGSQALTACDSKFHMASLWELLDPSSLKYDTDRGVTVADSGAGPPTGTIETPDALDFVAAGWIRTGSISSAVFGSDTPGHANCKAWTSNSGSDAGTAVGLEGIWQFPGSAVAPWVALGLACINLRNVWCMQD